jgi:pilus assembly protein Flp/PilA
MKLQFLNKKNQRGVTMIEYALLAALIAVAAIVAVTQLGVDIAALFTAISAAITGVTP